MFRRLAEVVLGPVRVHRQLPAFVGSGVVVANSKVGGLRYIFRSSGDLDPVLLKVASVLVRTGDVVWDVGGNVGLFAAAASGLAGKNGDVYSVEADGDAFELLSKTAKAQTSRHAPITPLQAAISNQCGTAKFNISKRARSTNSIQGLGSTQTGGTAEIRVVPTLTLDVLLESFPRPQVVKIDVEGAEALVLAGAERLLTAARPLVFIEVASEVSHEVARILCNHRYRIYDGATFKEIDVGQPATWDTVAIPSESNFSLETLNRGH